MQVTYTTAPTLINPEQTNRYQNHNQIRKNLTSERLSLRALEYTWGGLLCDRLVGVGEQVDPRGKVCRRAGVKGSEVRWMRVESVYGIFNGGVRLNTCTHLTNKGF